MGAEDEERPWRGRAPTTRPDPSFAPVPTALAVFFAVAVPSTVYAYMRPGAFEGYWIALGVALAVAAALAVGLALDHRRRR